MPDPLTPSTNLLMKLGSAIVHADEAMSDNGHAVDQAAFRAHLSDPEVAGWIEEMDAQSLLPVKRDV